jgi:hypothetical protein
MNASEINITLPKTHLCIDSELERELLLLTYK